MGSTYDMKNNSKYFVRIALLKDLTCRERYTNIYAVENREEKYPSGVKQWIAP